MRATRLAVALFAAASTLLALIRVELFATRQQPPVSTICGKLWKNQNSPGGSLHEVSGGAVHAVKRRQQKELASVTASDLYLRAVRTGTAETRARFLAALGASDDYTQAHASLHQVVKHSDHSSIHSKRSSRSVPSYGTIGFAGSWSDP